jgi:hypothetical protein
MVKWAQTKTQKTLKTMPQLKPLQDRLLSLGGDWVALQPEPDLEYLLEKGHLIKGKVKMQLMAPCQCHRNCAQIWDSNPKKYQIATGWALSEDGIWRQHTWLLCGKNIIETTQQRKQYYGIVLEDKDANNFWWQHCISLC